MAMFDRSGLAIDAPTVRAWHRAGALARHDSLLLWGCALDDAGARELAACALPDLHEAQLGFNRIGAAGARALARAAWPALRALLLYENRIGPDGLCALLAGGRAYERLNVCGNGLGVEGARVLAERMPQLTMLHAGYDALGDEGASAILCALPPTLAELNLRINGIERLAPQALERLAASSLVKLSFEDNPLAHDTVAAIARAIPPTLRALHLGGVGRAVLALLEAPPSHVDVLDLAYCDLTNDEVERLRRAPFLSRVTRLNVGDSDDGLRHCF
jgi:hypothetical protein